MRDSDGQIREITAEQAIEARREYAPVLRITSEIISGTIQIDFNDFSQLPFQFIQVLDIHRQFINEQKKDG